MDLYGIIRELRKEHDHLNDVIRSLDMLVKNEENSLRVHDISVEDQAAAERASQ